QGIADSGRRHIYFQSVRTDPGRYRRQQEGTAPPPIEPRNRGSRLRLGAAPGGRNLSRTGALSRKRPITKRKGIIVATRRHHRRGGDFPGRIGTRFLLGSAARRPFRRTSAGGI